MKRAAEKSDKSDESYKSHWLDQPQNIQRLWRGFLLVLVLTVLAEFVVHLHPAFEVEGWFGFHATFGLVSCALMIVAAKALGMLLKRSDTYYAKDETLDD